ncbi:MAG: NAD-dependent epimerase/dehydratase family protein [Mycobacteriales bacterium]
MRLLVLGGTRFVGRSLVLDALDRGWDVTALNRGVTGALPPAVRPLVADRTDRAQLAEALRGKDFDAVVDTWSAAPRVVQLAAEILQGQVGRFAYCSSISVYTDGRPVGGSEDWPAVEAEPGADQTSYPADKRGAELAAIESFPDALIGRPGLILGPYEDIGRLPWWLGRAARGGRMVAPGRPGRPLQYVDARDLAAWFNDNLAAGTSGIVDLTDPSGHTTTQTLLEAAVTATGSRAELVWIEQDTVLASGAEPWTQLPCWAPEGGEWTGFMEGDTSQAIATGLVSRDITDTCTATWQWLQRDGFPAQRPDRPIHGLPETLEAALLASVP